MKESNDDFESLRTLLSLKRHEVPPPGFFDKFSDNVVTRIRRGDIESPGTLGSRMSAEAPWLLRLIQSFQSKPAYTGVFASAAGLMLVAGIVYSENPSSGTDDLMPPQTAETGASIAAAAMTMPAMAEQAALPMQTVSLSSTNPVLNLDSGNSIFSGGSPVFQASPYPQ